MFAAKNELLTRPNGGYKLTRSLRLRSSASAYLNRTFGTPTSGTTWTWSGWVKLGTIPSSGTLFEAGTGATNTFMRCTFGQVSAELNWRQVTSVGGLAAEKGTSMLFRDPAAWYHIVCVWDTSNATAADRQRVYVNGVQVTSFGASTNPSLNLVSYFNTASYVHYLGALSIGGLGGYLDGYLAEVNFIDGQALAPSSFGAFNDYNVWQPKKYAGTYGTNGFYLPFTNNASTATLGNDFSGNSNTWTTNNISVTAGSTYDSMTDVPTLTSATAANYPVWNPLDTSSNGTLSRANLQSTSVGFISGKASIAVSNGKWYWEVTCTGGNYSGVGSHIGLDSVTSPCTSASSTRLGNTATSYSYNSWNGAKLNNSTSTAYGSTYTNGDVISVALDLNSGKIWWAKNGTWQASGDPAAGTNAAYSSIAAGLYTIAIGDDGGGGIVLDLNCGQQPFTYTPPTGYLALNTFNL